MAAGSFLYNDVDITYTDTGSGTPIVLLHGFAETGEVWQQQVAFLENNFRVMVPEIPGPGWKSSPQKTQLTGNITAAMYELPAAFPEIAAHELSLSATEIASSIDKMADALAAILKSIISEKVILIGHSMGGYITLAFAEKYPELLKAFGWVHSTAFADTDEKKETRCKGIDFIRKHGMEAFFKTSAPGLFSEKSKEEKPELVQRNIDLAVQFEPEMVIANYEAMIARPDRTAVLSGSKVPVLFILGAEDKAAPAADGLKQGVHNIFKQPYSGGIVLRWFG